MQPYPSRIVCLIAALGLCAPATMVGMTLGCGRYPLTQVGPGGDTIVCGGAQGRPFTLWSFTIAQGSIVGSVPIVTSETTYIDITDAVYTGENYPQILVAFVPTISGSWDVTGGAGYSLTATYSFKQESSLYDVAVLSGLFSGGNSSMNVTVTTPGGTAQVSNSTAGTRCSLSAFGLPYTCGQRSSASSGSVVNSVLVSSGPGPTNVGGFGAILSTPEPTPFVLAGLGLLFLASRRRRYFA
jgi:MYXO-CTERM domain-containing protein